MCCFFFLVRVLTDNVGKKAQWTVIQSFGGFDGSASIAEAVKRSLTQHDDTSLETTEDDRLNAKDRLANVVTPIGYRGFCHFGTFGFLFPTDLSYILIPTDQNYIHSIASTYMYICW